MVDFPDYASQVVSAGVALTGSPVSTGANGTTNTDFALDPGTHAVALVIPPLSQNNVNAVQVTGKTTGVQYFAKTSFQAGPLLVPVVQVLDPTVTVQVTNGAGGASTVYVAELLDPEAVVVAQNQPGPQDVGAWTVDLRSVHQTAITLGAALRAASLPVTRPTDDPAYDVSDRPNRVLGAQSNQQPLQVNASLAVGGSVTLVGAVGGQTVRLYHFDGTVDQNTNTFLNLFDTASNALGMIFLTGILGQPFHFTWAGSPLAQGQGFSITNNAASAGAINIRGSLSYSQA